MTNIIGLVLIAAVMFKELSYFAPHHMIHTRKSIGEWIIFGAGILVLILLAIRFASTWFHALFVIMGLIALSAMWLKQGLSSKGILTIARGKELYEWADINSVKIEVCEEIQVDWFKEDGSLILKQKYALKDIDALKEVVLRKKIIELQKNNS